MEINDGATGNGVAEVGESFSLNVDIQNYGLVDAEAFTIEVISSDPNVQIVNNSVSQSGLSSNGTSFIMDVANVVVGNGIEDQQVVVLEFVMTDVNGVQWISSGSITINAPDLVFTSYQLEDEDANQMIDYEETASLNLILSNQGHAATQNGLITVSSSFEFISLLESEISFESINELGDLEFSVAVLISDFAPVGESYTINVFAETNNGYSTNYEIEMHTPSCVLGEAAVLINLETDYYAEETAWSLTNANGDILESIEFGSLDAEQIYEHTYCMTPNTYLTYVIQDSYGDGITTEGYTITVCNQVVASGADFGNEAVVSFIAGCDQTLSVGCTDAEASNYDAGAVVDDGSCFTVGLEELINAIHVFPNPAVDKIQVEVGSMQIETISLMQMDGKEVSNTRVIDSKIELNIEDLDAGYYLIKITLKNGQSISKSVVVM